MFLRSSRSDSSSSGLSDSMNRDSSFGESFCWFKATRSRLGIEHAQSPNESKREPERRSNAFRGFLVADRSVSSFVFKGFISCRGGLGAGRCQSGERARYSSKIFKPNVFSPVRWSESSMARLFISLSKVPLLGSGAQVYR